MRTIRIALACAALAATTGCSILVSSELDDKDGPAPGSDAGRDSSMRIDAGPGTDTGPRTDSGPGTDAGPTGCTGAADGTPCGTGSVCIAEMCVDASCVTADECADGDACNGEEACGMFGACEPGDPPADGTTCVQLDEAAGICAGGRCVPPGCGNETIEVGEECDDGRNGDDLDGCRDDCTFTCEEDVDCDNGDPCDGEETCDAGANTCSPGTALVCTDGDECTMDLCETGVGCAFPLIDADGDGHAPDSLACGDDCDDTRNDVYTGASDVCGDMRDNDCNGTVDDGTPTWYVDCDRDSYAADTTGARVACMMPSSAETGCSGGWTVRRPADGTSTDCADGSLSARPGQALYFSTPIAGEPTATDFDYNCNGTEERQWTRVGLTGGEACTSFLGSCSGLEGWTSSFAPACGASGTRTYCYEDRTTGSCLRARAVTTTQRCR